MDQQLDGHTRPPESLAAETTETDYSQATARGATEMPPLRGEARTRSAAGFLGSGFAAEYARVVRWLLSL